MDYDNEASVHDISFPEVYDSDIAYLNDFGPAEPGSNLFVHPVQMSPTEEIDSNDDPSYFSDDYIDFRNWKVKLVLLKLSSTMRWFSMKSWVCSHAVTSN